MEGHGHAMSIEKGPEISDKIEVHTEMTRMSRHETNDRSVMICAGACSRRLLARSFQGVM